MVAGSMQIPILRACTLYAQTKCMCKDVCAVTVTVSVLGHDTDDISF